MRTHNIPGSETPSDIHILPPVLALQFNSLARTYFFMVPKGVRAIEVLL